MTFGKLILARIFDFIVIGFLIFGNQSMKLFSIAIVWILIAFCFIGIFLGAERLGKALGTDRSLARKLLSFIVAIGYISALIVSGHPLLAAAYMMIRLLMEIIAASTKEKSE